MLQVEYLSDQEEKLPALNPGNKCADKGEHILLLVHEERDQPEVRNHCSPYHHFELQPKP